MDALTFIVELVKALAWPATTVVFAVLFRRECGALLRRLKKGKVGLAEFEFEEIVKELEKDLAEISPATRSVTVETGLVSLATSNPRAALLSAWIELEAALKDLARRHQLVAEQPNRNVSDLIRDLAKAGLIPKAHVPIFMALRQLRNQAVHDIDFSPSPDAVVGYLEVAEELKQLIRHAPQER
jgi:hypothetical protein